MRPTAEEMIWPAEPPEDAGLPGGAVGDPAPRRVGDHSWHWRNPAGGEACPFTSEFAWHQPFAHPRRGAGWYVVGRAAGGAVVARVGPCRTTGEAADTWRSFFQTPAGSDAAVDDRWEERLAEKMEEALAARVRAAAEACAAARLPTLSQLGGRIHDHLSPTQAVDNVQMACDTRREWLNAAVDAAAGDPERAA